MALIVEDLSPWVRADEHKRLSRICVKLPADTSQKTDESTMTPKQFQARTMKGTARSYADNPGRLFHAVKPGQNVALCKMQPGKTSAGWDSFIGKRVTCPKCLKRLALLQIDPTDDEQFIFAAIGRTLAADTKYSKDWNVDFGNVLLTVIGIVAHEIQVRRGVDHPSQDQRQQFLDEAGEAVDQVVHKQIRLDGTTEGQGDSADATPFCAN